MRNLNALFIIPGVVLILSISVLSFSSQNNVKINLQHSNIPVEIDTIFIKKCYSCHSEISKNAFAKGKLNFSEWKNLSPEKLKSVKKEICEEVVEGAMPPKKFITKYPEKSLTAEEINVICNWSKIE